MNSFTSLDAEDVSEAIIEFFSKTNDVFLMVGTIEPRKGHSFVLQAFEALWEEVDTTASLCIIGREGWDVGDFVAGLKCHRELGKRLLFLYSAPDSELRDAYNNSTALIQASEGEGFGLPLIEAAQYGLPIICTDIPVFREIASKHVIYFERGRIESLKKCITDFLVMKENESIPDSSKIPMLTWEQSAENLFAILTDKDEKKWYAKICSDNSIEYLQSHCV
jgi:glycosyltransferase involved in cell wall biosynthesis